jgi:hypothetical protein
MHELKTRNSKNIWLTYHIKNTAEILKFLNCGQVRSLGVHCGKWHCDRDRPGWWQPHPRALDDLAIGDWHCRFIGVASEKTASQLTLVFHLLLSA